MSDQHHHPKHHQMVVTEHEHPDAWHTHTTDEPEPQHEHAPEIAAKRIIAFGVVGFILLAIVCQATIEYFKLYAKQIREEREEGAPVHVAALEKRSSELGAWSVKAPTYTPGDTFVRVPVADAAKKVMDRYPAR